MEYILLDGAVIDYDLEVAKKINTKHRCLYAGDIAPALKFVAPYLFTLPADHEFKGWIYNNIERFKSGVIVKTNASFEELYRHFRKFLIVKTDEGKQLYFRFYDPRVLPSFLETCDHYQLKEFFGPIAYFICTKENMEEVKLSFNGDQLKVEELVSVNKT